LMLEQIQNYCLVEIQELLNRNGRALAEFRTCHNLTLNDTSKTFLYKTIISRLRSKRKIVLAAASLGIVSLILPVERTAHSRQILPVIPKGKRADIVQACINHSQLWKHCKVFTLTRSMKVNEYYLNGEIDTRKQAFNQWALAVETYPNFIERQRDDAYLRERAILTPRNDDADAINAYMFDKFDGESITHNSADEIVKHQLIH
ncbi:ATP-dependent DNA helicase PIF1-like protein, partial [Tanacetum coccineum]